eukprot:1495862-Amphidinium_carterae.1
MSVVQGRPIEPGPVVMGQALPEPVQATYVTPPIQQNVYKVGMRDFNRDPDFSPELCKSA